MVDSFGMMAGLDGSSVSSELRSLFAIDMLSADAVTAVGVDLEGGFALFSERVAPTVVVHLVAPDQTQAFFDRERERGRATQSVIVDGKEVFSAKLGHGLQVSWVVADQWLWLHVAPAAAGADDTSWFTRSYRPGAPAWTASWEWAEAAARGSVDATARPAPTMIGVMDVKRVMGALVEMVRPAAACTKLVEPVSRIALGVRGDGRQAGGRISIELGPAAARLTAAALPEPEGWASVKASGALAAEWNLDLGVVRSWLEPCAQVVGADLRELDRYGVRAARAVLQTFDPDAKTGSGAVSLALNHRKFFASLLDEIPLRSTLERSRKFGPYSGYSLSIPFSGLPTVEYVLTDQLAFVAAGDGVLASLIGKGGTHPAGPLAWLWIAPSKLSADAWRALAELVDAPNKRWLVDHLMRWSHGMIVASVDGASLVLEADGTRK